MWFLLWNFGRNSKGHFQASLGYKYTLNFGQFLGVIGNIKRYLLDLVSSKLVFFKTSNCFSCHWSSNGKDWSSSKKELIENVFIDGDSKINIVTKKWRVQLGLSKPKLAPYNLHMVN
jgi:hypothetical protein